MSGRSAGRPEKSGALTRAGKRKVWVLRRGLFIVKGATDGGREPQEHCAGLASECCSSWMLDTLERLALEAGRRRGKHHPEGYVCYALQRRIDPFRRGGVLLLLFDPAVLYGGAGTAEWARVPGRIEPSVGALLVVTFRLLYCRTAGQKRTTTAAARNGRLSLAFHRRDAAGRKSFCRAGHPSCFSSCELLDSSKVTSVVSSDILAGLMALYSRP